jgi:hypothetical protein
MDLPVRPVVAVTEEQLQHDVEELLGELERWGVVWHHCGDPRRCHGPGGLPDLIAAGPGGLLAAEMKSADGELSADQQAWGWAWSRGAIARVPEYVTLRPDDLASGLIEHRLRSLIG